MATDVLELLFDAVDNDPGEGDRDVLDRLFDEIEANRCKCNISADIDLASLNRNQRCSSRGKFGRSPSWRDMRSGAICSVITCVISKKPWASSRADCMLPRMPRDRLRSNITLRSLWILAIGCESVATASNYSALRARCY